uniref:Reverse transcriptase Ty1/copia-type domain-containing protein n=1 Tax=Tanacetum cinerariifolium TaxID=118510 RepID=A0A6L2LBU0_TANCI|nr:hypothetical protein [Tanacetum cinerariifolium]
MDFGKCFVPQQELSAEQAFWFQMSNPTTDSSEASPIKVDVPSELPKVSLVNARLKKIKFHLAQYDSVVKKRITPDAITEGKEIVNTAAQTPIVTTVIPGMFKLDLDPLAPSLEPALHEMTPATPNSGLVSNPPPSASFVPPSRHKWDLVFQLVFDEFFSPSDSVVSPLPKVEALALVESTGSPSLTSAVRIFLTFVAHMNMIVYQMDVKTAVLNRILREEIYAPRAWYGLLSSFLLSQGFFKGMVDLTLFIKREGKDILLKSKLDEDPQGKAVDPTHYRGMVGTLMYLTSSRPDLVYAVCICARTMVSKDSAIALTGFADADHAGCQDTRRSTSGSMQLLGDRLVSWSSKRQKSAAISSTEAEYIALAVVLKSFG